MKKKLLLKSDLYVCSSDFEGFPNTVVEAINYRLPVISTRSHGGINEILLNGSEVSIMSQEILMIYPIK